MEDREGGDCNQLGVAWGKVSDLGGGVARRWRKTKQRSDSGGGDMYRVAKAAGVRG